VVDVAVEQLREESLLSDVVVVEVASEVAGPFTARLLADLGARCIKIEPSGGDPTRRWGPFRDDVEDIDASGAFLVWNHGKESVVLDLESAEGTTALDALLAHAQILVEDGRLDVDELRARFPHLVIVSVTPFGREGWGAGRPATDAVAYAIGGAMSSTGRPDRPPYHLGGSLIQAFVGSAAATAAMAGLLAAEDGGEGQWIDVAWVEAEAGSVDRSAPYLLGYIYSGLEALQEPARARGLPGGSYPCADGNVVASTYGWTIRRMLDTVGDPELDAVLGESLGNVYRPVGREVLDRVLPAWMAARTKEEITELAQSKGWAVTPSNTVLEVIDDPFLEEAGALERVDAGRLGELVLPGPAFVTPGGPRFRRRAPNLGEHTEIVLAELVPDGVT
jgi:crotonobetainyl-CoA:carnitine CoA-transferase CaiB-like acyl-CoA transferase